MTVVYADDEVAPLETGNPEIYDNLVFGLGPGTVAVIIAGIISLIIILFKDSTTTPSLIVGIAVAIPLIVLAIVRGMPVKSLSSDTEKKMSSQLLITCLALSSSAQLFTQLH